MERESGRRTGYSLWTWLVLVWTSFVFYVLSIGPVAALLKDANWSTIEIALAFYAPVIWLYDHTPLKGPLDAYVGLWGLK
jgi:hypothetical protein